jgi:hypothetical protein
MVIPKQHLFSPFTTRVRAVVRELELFAGELEHQDERSSKSARSYFRKIEINALAAWLGRAL